MIAPAAGNGTDMTGPAADLSRPIVVGIDGSDHSLFAAEVAAEEARLRELPLRLVTALSPTFQAPLASPPDVVSALPGVGPTYEELRAAATETLHSAAAHIRQQHPDLPMVSHLLDGYPGGVLTDASAHATLILLGHRGHGGFPGMLVGSVAMQLATHAACPVIITRGQQSPSDFPVVVGVDGSYAAQQAAEFAADAAARYKVPLVALYAWPWDAGWAPEQIQAGAPPPEVPDAVSQSLGALANKYPQIDVRTEVRAQVAAHEALVGASAAARLVVVGSRGRGGFRGLLLGSVSQALINHARCPVAVVGPQAE